MRRYIKFLIAFCVLSAQLALAQTIDRKVVNVNGGPVSTTNRQLIYNLGETFATPLSGGGIQLRQGFLQPVKPPMPPILGDRVLCAGNTTSLTNTTTGGTWSSSNPAIASVNLLTGVVTGVGGGTATIAYVTNTSNTSAVVTVNIVRSAGTITGDATVYLSNTKVLTDTVAGGTWSSGNTAVATVNSTGVVTGLALGTATISYEVVSACGTNVATRVVTVTPVPVHVTGTYTMCPGAGTTISADIAGGTWSSSNPEIASVNTSGLVSGITSGTSAITYVVGLVNAVAVVTVMPAPAVPAITGYPWASTINPTNTTQLANTAVGGIWSSSATGIATVNGTGLVTGVSSGTAIISYRVNGTYCSTTSTTNVTISNAQNGLRFDGVNDYVDIANNPSFETNTGTVEFWIRPEWAPGAPGIGNPATVEMRTGGPGLTRYSFHMNNLLDGVGLYNGTIYSTVPFTFAQNVWYHLAFVYSTTNCVVYVNGNNIGTIPIGITASVTGLPMRFGIAEPSFNFEPLPGTLDEVRIWNTQRTASQIQTNRNCDIPAQAGLVAYYRFNQGTAGGNNIGSTVRDYSNNERCGSTVNMAMFGTASNFVTGVMGTCDVIATTSGPLTGTFTVCPGTTSALGTNAPGGIWTSSNPAVATISGSGVVTGVSLGTTVISYMRNCAWVGAVVTVTSLPNAGTITGIDSVITQGSLPLTASVAGGVWSSSNATVASVGSAGIVNGLVAGTTIISYTVTNACTSANATKLVRIVPSFTTPITGDNTICVGTTTTLANATPGGTWTSSNPSVATISTTGLVTAVSTGSTTISYTLSGTTATVIVSVATTPPVGFITGITNICTGTPVTLTCNVSGGSWVAGNANISIDTAGVLSGISAGTALVSYTISNLCATVATTTNIVVTATPTTTALTLGATPLVCVGATTTIPASIEGGTWISSTTGIASVGLNNGIITGVAAGNTTLSYKVTNSCGTGTVTRSITVTGMPVAGSIVGASAVCMGSTITPAIATAGGTWSSSNTSVATIGSTGIVAPVATGTATISYTIANACTSAVATRIVTVMALPEAGTISGTDLICKAANATFTATETGGTWSSTGATVASVSASGVVTGVNAGTAAISYRKTNACGTVATTQTVTVVAPPVLAAITGTATVCPTSSTNLLNTTTGGGWTSGNELVATVGSSGVVYGVSPGTAAISYSLSNECGTSNVSRIVTVNTTPIAGSITGATSVVAGSSTTLSSTATSGTWSSSSPTVATIGATGVVNALTIGHTNISYTVTNSCGTATASTVVSVTPSPTMVSGTLKICVGSNTNLLHPVAGGAWTSSNPTVATVNPVTGMATGLAVGTSVISYTTTSGFTPITVTGIITVNALPAVYTGSNIICVGSMLNLSGGITGCTWSSSNTAIATVVASTGHITGINEGTTTVSYTNAAGCQRAIPLTVNAQIAAIGGIATICNGDSLALTNATPGGNWTSSNALRATVNATTGTLTAVSGGTCVVSYIVSAGCFSTATVNVGTPPAITGNLNLCLTGSTQLTSTGGDWYTGDADIATVSATGLVTAVSAGTVNISYISPSGCSRIAVVTVTPLSGIAGGDYVCTGGTISLSESVTGGVWSANNGNISIGVVTGLVTGITPGTTLVTYTAGSTCQSTKIVTVLAQPTTPINGPGNVCAGSQISLTSSEPGGTWTSNNIFRATINSTTGQVSALNAGTVIITYNTFGGCYRTRIISVYPSIMPVSGTLSICESASTSLSSATTGCIWSSTNASVATISAGGVATGVSGGVATISYTSTATGCAATVQLTVNAIPPSISGVTAPICIGETVTATNAIPGGTWSTTTGININVGTNTGAITGVAAGVARISYRLPTGCFTTSTLNVNPVPNTISGPSAVNELSSVTLSTVSTGGTWSSSNTAVATIGSGTGVATGVATGNTTITYRFTATGCFRTRTLTVNPFGTRPMAATAEEKSITVFPSPTNGLVNVQTAEAGTAGIYTVDGKLIEQYRIAVPMTSLVLPHSLASGMYLCRFESETGAITTVRLVLTR